MDSLLALLDQNDLIKIRLVRALLALPEVLVLDEVGDDMSVQDLQECTKYWSRTWSIRFPALMIRKPASCSEKLPTCRGRSYGLDLRELYNRTWTRRTSCSSSKTLQDYLHSPRRCMVKKKENFVHIIMHSTNNQEWNLLLFITTLL